jgi:hypothetical protein
MGKRTQKSSKGKKGQKQLASRQLDRAQTALVKFGADYQRTNPVVGISRSLQLICPAAMRVPIKYSCRLALLSAIGVYVEHNFTGNGLFDPDVTGTGTQPTGFDQWMAFFQRYRVIASHFRARVINPTAATNAAAMADISIVPTNTTTAFANSDIAGSQPYARRNLVNEIGMGPNGPARLEASMETDLILGTSRDAVISEENYSGTASANPSNLWYWRLTQEPADLASNSTGIYEIEITYLVDFYERQINVASSSAVPKVGRKLERKPTV